MPFHLVRQVGGIRFAQGFLQMMSRLTLQWLPGGGFPSFQAANCAA
jgi:hypothetical protein